MEDYDMKRNYRKPAIKVVRMQHHSHLLAGSPGARSLINSEGFMWTDGLVEYDV
jgi:hypothetical protein